MTTVGYARVSSLGQDLTVQFEKLSGCDKVFKEKRSGVDAGRPALKACLEYLREGDTLVVTKLDRLARSTSDLYRIVSELMQRGVEFKVLDDPSIDTSSRTGKLVMGILALIAEFENDIRRERQQDGINKAKAVGIRFGPKPILTLPVIEKIRALRADGTTVPEIMRRTKLSKASVYRALGGATQACSGLARFVVIALQKFANPEPWSRLATPDCLHVSGKWVPCETRRGS